MHLAILDEDICGDHLLAEARVSLVKIFPQMQKQFQVCLHKPVFKVNRTNSILFCKRLFNVLDFLKSIFQFSSQK